METEKLEHFRRMLREKKRFLISKLQDARSKEEPLSEDEMMDSMDLASTVAERSLYARFRGRERSLIAEIDAALKKIAAGEFGICEECDEPIGVGRLKAQPMATLCVKCKEEMETIRTYGRDGAVEWRVL